MLRLIVKINYLWGQLPPLPPWFVCLCNENNYVYIQDVHREMTIQAQNGTQWYLIEVIAFIMRHLKELLEERLSRTFHPLKATNFNWVIAVPAIWQARGRGMIREAAYMVSSKHTLFM